MPEFTVLDDDWEARPDDVPDAMPAGPSGPAQPGVITAVVAAITAARHRPVRQGRPPQQCGASDDQAELQDAAHHVQRADRFRVVQVRTEREADGARRHVHRDNDGVPGDAQPQPQPRRPPEQDRGPYHLGPRDHQEEDAVQRVFREVFEHDREMDGRGAGGERRQAAQKVRPDRGRPGADFLAREDRSAHTTDARFAITPPHRPTGRIRATS
jgi:hypothetical protein